MKVAFLLPNYSGHRVGSTDVYYNFAKGLAEEGHSVDLWHPARDEGPGGLYSDLRDRIWSVARSAMPRPVSWFEFPRGARPRFRSRLSGIHLDHDRVVAFSWRAIEALAAVSGGGRRFGYVVEYETWRDATGETRSRMRSAYRRNLPMLASSEAVRSMLLEEGASDVRLSVHGIDRDTYHAFLPVAGRAARRIGCPIRMESVKSPEILERTLALLRAAHGSTISIWGFGGRGAPASLLGLFDEVHPSPTSTELANLYNGTAVFLLPSRSEGFGMPAAEAMSCGAATVVADNGGIHTFGEHGRNCWIVPAGDPSALAEAVEMLLADSTLRERLGTEAARSLDFLSWPNALERFKGAVEIP